MSVHHQVKKSGGTIAGVNDRIGDINRRLNDLETAAGVIDQLDGASIAPDSITANEIAVGSITASELAVGSVTASALAADSVTAVAIAADSVTANEIAANTITANEIAAGTITASQIAANTITANQIAAGTITASQIAAGTITASQIAANTITAAQITAGGITTAALAAGSVTASIIAANAINATHISANSIQAGDIAADAVNAAAIQANAITASKIAADAIQTTHLSAGSVTADAILSGSVTSDKINVATLSALTTNMGSLTAGTITGATFQTAASGSRVVMDTLGMRGYALNGVTKVFEINSGSGIASFTGVAILDPTSVVPGGSISGVIPSNSVPGIGGGNALTNSSFEDGVTDWASSASTITASATKARFGSNSCRVVATTTGASYCWRFTTASRPLAFPGSTYTVSGYFLNDVGTRNLRIEMRFIDGAGAQIGATVAGNQVTSSTTWTRSVATAVAPANTVRIAVLADGTSGAIGDAYYVDGVQLEEGEVATAYAPKPDEILPGSITGAQIAPTTITGANITSGTITNTHIGDVAAGKVSGTLTNSQIADLASGKITGQLTDAQIAAIAAAKITGQIGNTQIAQGAVDSSKLSVLIGGGNLLINSSFEDPTLNGWAAASIHGTIASSTAQARSGTRSVICTSTDATGAWGVYTTNPTFQVQARAGDTYTASYYIRSAAVSRQTWVRIDYFNSSHTLLSSTTGATGTTTTTGWTRNTVTGVAPANTAYIGVVVVLNAAGSTGEVHYVDDVQLEVGDVITAYAPKNDEILPGTITGGQIATGTITGGNITSGTITNTHIGDVAATKVSGTLTSAQIADIAAVKITGQLTDSQLAAIAAAKITGQIVNSQLGPGSVGAAQLAVNLGGGNMLTNSSFENGIVDWSPSGSTATTVSTQARFGSNSCQVTASTAGTDAWIFRGTAPQRVPGVVGATYTGSVYVLMGSGSRTLQIILRFFDNAGVQIGSQILGTSSVAPTTWTRLSVTATAPAGTTSISFLVRGFGGLAGDTYYVDGAQLEESDVPTAYAPKNDEILPGTITGAQIAAGTITGSNITNGTITNTQIGDIAAGKVTGQLTDAQLASISAAKLLGQILAGQVGFTIGGGNMLKDSSFAKTGLPDWGTNNATISSTSATSRPGYSTTAALVTATANTSQIRNTANGLRIPVVAGSTYTASAWVKAATTSRAVRVYLDFYDASNVRCAGSPVAGSAIGSDTNWVRPTVTATAPSNAVTGAIIVEMVSALTGEVHYVDDAQLEDGEVATAYSPKPDEILPGTVTGAHIAPVTITSGNITSGTITGTQIQQGAVRASELQGDLVSSLTTTWRNEFNDVSGLYRSTVQGGTVGAITSQAVSDASGGYVGRTTTPGAAWYAGTVNIPYDPTRLYRIRAKIRTTVDSTGGTNKAIYVGFVGVAADGVSFVSINGALSTTSLGSSHYVAAAAVVPSIGTGWTTYTGYVKGTGAVGTSTVRSDPDNPGVMHQSVRYIRPIFILNYNGGDSTTEIDDITIDVIDLPDNIVSSPMLQSNVVTAAKIAANTITAGQIAADTITGNEIAANAISTLELAANAVTAAKITANTITAAQIAANTITAAQIAANTITAAQIAANTITASQIAADAITASELAAGAVTASEIAAGAVVAGKIAAGTITSTEIAASTILATNIAAGAITANKLSVLIGGGNMIANSGVEDSISPLSNYFEAFSNSTVARVTTPVRSGGASLRITSAAAGNMRARTLATTTAAISVEPSTSYSGSVYTKASTVARACYVDVSWLDSTGAQIGSTIVGSSTTNNTSTWTRHVLTLTSPANTAYAVLALVVVGTAAAGEIHYADDWQFEPGDVPTAYSPKPDEILPGTIVAAQIAAGTITATQIATDTITATQIAANAINTSELAANAVTAAKIAANTITASQIAASTITATQIAANTITASQIAADAITASELAAGAVTASEIAAGAVIAGKIAAGAVTATELAAGAVVAGKIAAGSITSTEIAASTILATNIAAGAITANKLSVLIGGGNMVPNSGIEDAISPLSNSWAVSANCTVARVTTPVRSGVASLRVTSVAAGDMRARTLNGTSGISIEPSTSYTASMYTKAGTTPRSTQAQIAFYDAAGASISTALGTSVTNNTSTWTRTVCTATSPANAAYCAPIIQVTGTGAAGEIHYADDFQLEPGDVPTAYSPKPDEILPGTIVASQIAADTITSTQIAADAITVSELAANAVTAAKIAANTITAAQIAANTITASQIAADAITASELAAGAVTASEIAAGAVIAGKIAAGVITSTEIAASTILASNIAAGAITANKLSVIVGGGNLVSNSSFENTTLAGWATASGSQNTIASTTAAGTFRSGSAAVSCVSIATTSAWGVFTPSPGIQARVGDTYTASAYTKSAAVSRQTWVRIDYYSAAQALLSSTTGATSNTSTTAWTRQTVTGVAPANTAFIRVVVIFNNAASVGETHYVDDVQLEVGDVVTSYSPKPDEILPGTIVANMVAANAITAGTIAANAVTAGTIATNAVTAGTIAANAVTATELAAGSVTTAKMTANTINGDRITANTLDATKIVALSITSTQIAAGAITANTIAAGAVQAQSLSVKFGGSNLVRNAQMAYGVGTGFGWTWPGTAVAVKVTTTTPLKFSTAAKLTSNSIGALWISNGLVTYSTLTNAQTLCQVEAGKKYTISAWVLRDAGAAAPIAGAQMRIMCYNESAVQQAIPAEGEYSANVATSATAWTRIQYTFTAPANTTRARVLVYPEGNSSTVPAGQDYYISGVQCEEGDVATAYGPKGDEILPGSVGNTEIAPDSITTDKILAGTILGGDIAATTITGGNILGNTITANKLSVSTLSAITADMGTITAGTITGATLQTAASGQRVVINSTGIKQYATDGTTIKVLIPSDGSDATFTGILNSRGLKLPYAQSALLASPVEGRIDWAGSAGFPGRTFSMGSGEYVVGPDTQRFGYIGSMSWGQELATSPDNFISFLTSNAGGASILVTSPTQASKTLYASDGSSSYAFNSLANVSSGAIGGPHYVSGASDVWHWSAGSASDYTSGSGASWYYHNLGRTPSASTLTPCPNSYSLTAVQNIDTWCVGDWDYADTDWAGSYYVRTRAGGALSWTWISFKAVSYA